jgi:hypothetical protein
MFHKFNSILKNALSKLCRLITLNINFRLRIGMTFVFREWGAVFYRLCNDGNANT